ncbi:hypothetical protein HaLaN_07266 [Haematococcus lacustris]|uniref:Uncharacterized protein n=1 Tax=Haematococcus lacustris TaxID=44745 RepID=A0A699YP20_HAELA|nr:hypothetical protein HaLaN_07266 [Haematococcus lacustris]
MSTHTIWTTHQAARQKAGTGCWRGTAYPYIVVCPASVVCPAALQACTDILGNPVEPCPDRNSDRGCYNLVLGRTLDDHEHLALRCAAHSPNRKRKKAAKQSTC